MFIMIALVLTALCTAAAFASSTSKASSNPSPYRKIEEYSGPDFFSGFTTFTGPDPTGGFVDYQSLPSAAEKNLTAFVWREEANTTNAFIGVDYHELSATVNATGGRKSVRLVSKATFDVGLLTVLDIVHAPTGPGLWPAIWLLGNVTGEVWPDAGEQDIVEWVNDDTSNAMTLHTSPDCVVERHAQAYLGTMGSTNCNSGEGSEGCSINAPAHIVSGGRNMSTAGPGFNTQGGGMYVHEWADHGVTEWLFPRDRIPSDLADERPDPRTWAAKPLARWTGSSCRFKQAFQRQQLIINICLCGDWAGEVWQSSGMTNQTGVATCDAWVANHPEAFKEAYFEFANIKMYSKDAGPGAKGKRAKRDRPEVVRRGAHVDRHRHHRHHRLDWRYHGVV